MRGLIETDCYRQGLNWDRLLEIGAYSWFSSRGLRLLIEREGLLLERSLIDGGLYYGILIDTGWSFDILISTAYHLHAESKSCDETQKEVHQQQQQHQHQQQQQQQMQQHHQNENMIMMEQMHAGQQLQPMTTNGGFIPAHIPHQHPQMQISFPPGYEHLQQQRFNFVPPSIRPGHGVIENAPQTQFQPVEYMSHLAHNVGPIVPASVPQGQPFPFLYQESPAYFFYQQWWRDIELNLWWLLCRIEGQIETWGPWGRNTNTNRVVVFCPNTNKNAT